MTDTPDVPPVDDDQAEPLGDHHVPGDLVELHEVLEWQAAVAVAPKAKR